MPSELTWVFTHFLWLVPGWRSSGRVGRAGSATSSTVIRRGRARIGLGTVKVVSSRRAARRPTSHRRALLTVARTHRVRSQSGVMHERDTMEGPTLEDAVLVAVSAQRSGWGRADAS